MFKKLVKKVSVVKMKNFWRHVTPKKRTNILMPIVTGIKGEKCVCVCVCVSKKNVAVVCEMEKGRINYRLIN